MGPDDELFTQVTVCAGALPEGEAIRLTQEVPGFAVVGVGVEAGVSLGTNQQGCTFHDLAHGHDTPGFFRQNRRKQEGLRQI